MFLRPVQFLSVFITGFAIATASPANAQARPSASQAQALLKSRPELLSQLQQGIAGSGLTPDQVRARLAAEGYPAGLLDSYLGQGTTNAPMPTADVFAAVRSLGLLSETDVDELMRLAGTTTSRGVAGAPTDSTPADSGLAVFGLSLFREQSSLFLPNLDGPVDASYRLGPGDQLVLILTGDVELAHTLDVTREGFVVIPQVGQIGVANLTLGELEDLLYVRLGRAYSGVRRSGATTRFSVSVSRLRSNQVFVTGDVVAPGSYRVTSAGTALTALYAAGGPSAQGTLRAIEIRRAGKLVSTLDVYDYLLRGDGSKDVRLQQGDIVFVPVHGRRARILGGVTRPATYEVKAGETLADLLRAAGGFSAQAARRRFAIERVLPAGQREVGRDRIVLEVPLTAEGPVPAESVEDGDIIRVPTVADRVRGRVLVSGHVWSTGPQGYTAGLTLEQALARAGGIKSDAYLGTVHVSRLLPDSTRIQLRSALRDTTGATVRPFALQEDDEVIVYSRTSFRPEQFVVISGAVRNGGRFPFRSGMTLRDLTLMAGGPSDHAYLIDAEVARVPEERDSLTTARSIRVPIDSSYAFHSPLDGTKPEFELRPNDNVLFLRDPTWREPRRVTLTGEVRFPGSYTLQSRAERLSDVVRRAGGLTTEADPDGAFFARLVKKEESQRVRESESRRATRAGRDSVEASAQSGGGAYVSSSIRVGVDLREALSGRGRSDDLLMEDGDSVDVPLQRQTVSVRGAVNAPTALAHAGRRLGFYLDAAGGTTERARSRRAYVIQPNGKIESRRRALGFITLDPKPRAGAVVVVPERGEIVPSTNAFATVGIVTQLLASLAAIVAVSR